MPSPKKSTEPMTTVVKKVGDQWVAKVKCGHSFKATAKLSESALMSTARHIKSHHKGYHQEVEGV